MTGIVSLILLFFIVGGLPLLVLLYVASKAKKEADILAKIFESASGENS